MLTIFTVPKPFTGHIDVIQRNAIQSWRSLDAKCEVILCGNEAGTKETADELGISCIADIALNEYGTPLLSSVFSSVADSTHNELLCYVNTDVILTNSLVDGVKRVPFGEFLMIGQRWDLELNTMLDCGYAGWEEELQRRLLEHAVLHSQSGSDYFVFRRGRLIEDFPPFAVGRPGWDNWFIYRARNLRIPVIDATQVVTTVHQNHDYDHVESSKADAWEGPEADRNRELMGGWGNAFTQVDATHVLTPKRLSRALDLEHVRRRLRVALSLLPGAPRLRRFSARHRRRTRDSRGQSGA